MTKDEFKNLVKINIKNEMNISKEAMEEVIEEGTDFKGWTLEEIKLNTSEALAELSKEVLEL